MRMWTDVQWFHVCVCVKALEVIENGLCDCRVRTGRRYSLLQRARKICQSSAVKKSPNGLKLWQSFAGDVMNSICEPPSVISTSAQLFINLCVGFIFLKHVASYMITKCS